MATDPPFTSYVRVPPSIAEKFPNVETPGGGWQRYVRWLHTKLSQSRTLELSDSEVRRIITYSRGSGGYQSHSRELLRVWYEQNGDNADISGNLRLKVRAALRTPRATDYASRHYKAIGGILAAASSRLDDKGRRWLADQFADLFERDNRDFDRERWLETCELVKSEK